MKASQIYNQEQTAAEIIGRRVGISAEGLIKWSLTIGITLFDSFLQIDKYKDPDIWLVACLNDISLDRAKAELSGQRDILEPPLMGWCDVCGSKAVQRNETGGFCEKHKSKYNGVITNQTKEGA